MTVSRHLMDSPAAAANRLFVGAGLGLLLVTGLALQRGMLDFNEVSVGWSIPICAILCFLIGRGGLISNYFPDENDSQLVSRIADEIAIEEKEADVGGAWAQLEADLLSQEIGEDE